MATKKTLGAKVKGAIDAVKTKVTRKGTSTGIKPAAKPDPSALEWLSLELDKLGISLERRTARGKDNKTHAVLALVKECGDVTKHLAIPVVGNLDKAEAKAILARAKEAMI